MGLREIGQKRDIRPSPSLEEFGSPTLRARSLPNSQCHPMLVETVHCGAKNVPGKGEGLLSGVQLGLQSWGL